MRMPKNLCRRAILAGVGMALAGTVVAGASAADAATTGAHAVSSSTKLADYNVSVKTSGHRISGRAAIKDTTSGNDYVAVQVFLQRWSGSKWVTVVKGPRKAANNYAVSTIGSRACTPGRYYRSFANYNWNNRARWSAATKYVTC